MQGSWFRRLVVPVSWSLVLLCFACRRNPAEDSRPSDDDAARKTAPEVLDKTSELPAIRELAQRHTLMQRARQWRDSDPAQKKALVADAVAFVQHASVDITQFQLVMNLGQMMEMSGDTELAAELFQGAGPVFRHSDDQDLAGEGARLEGIVRRLTLAGKPMEIEGTRLDGTAFDWSAYRGKVVLVDFWATWCPPCRAELPNLKENYLRYHDRGFDIVGISLDTDRKELEEFIASEDIPWAILYHEDPNGNQPLAEYYGITGIPTAILVGRQGTVVTLAAHGAQLTSQLEQLLGKAGEPVK